MDRRNNPSRKEHRAAPDRYDSVEYKRKRRRKARRRVYFISPVASVTLGTLAALILILLLIMMFNSPRGDVPASARTVQRTQSVQQADLNTPEPEEVAAEPTALPGDQNGGDGALSVLPQATATPTPEPTATPEVTPGITFNPLAEQGDYLPVFHRGDSIEKKIAITVDDCFQMENLREIIRQAYNVGGKLTIFPIGENLSLPGMAETLKVCALQLGYEIENHTWSHARIFRLPEQEMAEEIWKQSQALNQALGVNYEQHFLRLMGGDGDNDQRTHNYLKQLGFLGIAYWSLSGSDAELDQIEASLSPGMIYLFHTTDRDTAILQQFIPYAASMGYELVTMNELLGFEPNAMYEYAPMAMPQPAPYEPDYKTRKKGDYAWIVVQMQDKLRAMGYLQMDGPSTGYYGDQTAQAVKAYQQAEGLEATGEADAETQKRLLSAET